MRIVKVLLGSGILMTGAAVGFAQDVPRYNVDASCRGVSKSLHQRVGPESELTIDQRVARCVKTEEGARERVVKEWPRFSAADRSACIGATSSGGTASYVELLVCLGMKDEVAKMRSRSNEQPSPRN